MPTPSCRVHYSLPCELKSVHPSPFHGSEGLSCPTVLKLTFIFSSGRFHRHVHPLPLVFSHPLLSTLGCTVFLGDTDFCPQHPPHLPNPLIILTNPDPLRHTPSKTSQAPQNPVPYSFPFTHRTYFNHPPPPRIQPHPKLPTSRNPSSHPCHI